MTRQTGVVGTFGLAATRVLGLGLVSGSTIVFARLLGPSSFGVYASASAILAVVLILGNVGIDQLYLRWDIELDQLKTRSLQLAAVTVTLSWLGAAAWPGLTPAVRVCIALLGAAAAVDDLKLPYILEPQRRLNFLQRGRRELALQSIVVVVSVAVAFLRPSPQGIAGAVLLGAILGLAPAARSIGALRSIFVPGVIRLVRVALPYCLAGAIYTAYFQIDGAILASLRPAAEVGFYRAAYSLVFALVLFPVALNNDTMLARYYAAGDDERHRVLRRFALASFAGGIVAVAFVEALGPFGVHLLFGESYEPAVGLVRVLGLALLPHFLNSWAGNSLVGRGRVRLVAGVQLTLLVVNVVGNLIFIPSVGARGAAWMTLVTEVTGTILYGLVVIRTSTRDADGRPAESFDS